jgi:primosomal protein N'
MYLFLVIPLASGLPMPYLSYFSKEVVALGTLLPITIKKRKIFGIVISCEKVEMEKMSIKSASYPLKKISAGERRAFIPPKFAEALLNFAEETVTPVPELFTNLIPERLITKKVGSQLYANQKTKKGEILLLGLPYEERLLRYRSIIRESFARNESIVIFFPTIRELNLAKDNLSRGIEDYTLSLHSEVTGKDEQEIDQKFSEFHPLLLLSTPSLWAFERSDLGYFIIENEISQHYHSNFSSIDFRALMNYLSLEFSLPLLFGSTLLSLARFSLREDGRASELTPLYLRADNTFKIIAMNDEKRSKTPLLSIEALRELEHIKELRKGHYFIYTQRKGMYPSTVCADCSTLLLCKGCEKPLVLHTIGQNKAYMCHYCESFTAVSEDHPISCSHCGGWRMRLIGIASSGIEALLSKAGIPIFVIDGERTKTKKEVLAVYDAWRKESFGVLIGTELALNIISECDNATIASLDSLFSLPEYTTDEKILSLLLTLKEKTKGVLLLQTRMTGNPLFENLSDYSFLKYYKWALEERKSLHLPPYYVILKTEFRGIKDEEKNRITEILFEKKWEHVWFESGPQKMLLIIHIEEKTWFENKAVRDTVRQIASSGTLSFNPENLFS